MNKMKIFTFRKRLLALAVCAFAWIGANAYEVRTYTTDDGVVVAEINGGDWVNTTVQDAQGDQHTAVSGVAGAGLPSDFGFTDEEKAMINAASKLVIKGYVEDNKWTQAHDWSHITSVDMSEAHFKQDLSSTETYTYEKFDPNGNPKYTTVTKTYMSNEMRFYNFTAASEIVLSNYVESIWEKTVDGVSALTTTFTIPASVKYIDGQSIVNTPISNITIPATVEYIAKEAFRNAQIENLIAVKVEGYTAAASEAFDRKNTVGQTDAGYVRYCSLEYPKEAEEYFYNSNHVLTQEVSLNQGRFQSWLSDHLTAAAAPGTHPNGWKEFINSGSEPPVPVPEGKKVVLRTFSDKVARLVPLDFRAYIVNGVDSTIVTEDGVTKKQYTLQLRQIFAIPAYTGVILYGEIQERDNSFRMATIPSWSPGGSLYEPPYNRFSPDRMNVAEQGTTAVYVSTRNYLVPTLQTTYLYPYYKDATMWDDIKAAWTSATSTSGWDHYSEVWPFSDTNMSIYSTGAKVTDRNFTLARLKGTTLKNAQEEDYMGFFRVSGNGNGSKCGENKAYLSLPATMFTSAAGAEALVVKPTGEQAFRSAEWNTAVSTGNWGQRAEETGVLEVKIAGDFEDTVVDGITNISKDTIADDSYYTLQGIKVVLPQKGVYIKNGKKVIVK